MLQVRLTDREPVRSTISSFIANLPELLGAFTYRDEPYVAIIEFEDDRYIQFWVNCDFIAAEIVSNLFATTEPLLTTSQEDTLRAAGWSQPQPTNLPNWRIERHGPKAVTDISMFAAHAVLEILQYGRATHAPVVVSTFAPRKAETLPDAVQTGDALTALTSAGTKPKVTPIDPDSDELISEADDNLASP